MCMDTPFFIFINGKGSSGKDTQAGFLKDYFGEKAITLSTGEICRDAQKEASPYYQYLPRIAPYIYHVEKEGGYYPDEVIIGIVQDIVENQIAEDKNVFIFTGFPRTEGQLMAVEGMLGAFQGAESYHLYYQIPDDVSRDRAKIRREDAEATGKEIRPDDAADVVERRIASFHKLTMPMLGRLNQEGCLFVVDATGTIADVERETSFHFSKEKLG